MITDEQRNLLKKYLKGVYVQDVQEKLNRRGITSRLGKPYSDKMISHVLNGRYENAYIERALFEVYEERKAWQETQEENRNEILGLVRISRKNIRKRKY
ncbi:hypothetical protein [Ascidiimonas aurantiaca]|uniref:hypothetical protein n=1 Tax=Ascidiimonas aurantiaca TaxID=1685432 RepID=UPI0030EBD06B